MKPIIFIHTNSKQLLGAKISEYSLRKTSDNPDKFDIRIIQLEDYPALYQRQGQPYLREGRHVVWNNHDLQSFTPLRFLPPQIMGYQGRAIVVDPDVFALADIGELLTRDMQGQAIVCRQIFPSDGRPPYYASSVMLLDCSQLLHWRWEEQIEEMFSFKRDYRSWMSLLLEPEGRIGFLEEEWNHFDTLNENTKLLHNTGRRTQPWKTGLPIDFMPKPLHDAQPAKKWGVLPQPWISRIKAFLRGQAYHPYGTYQQHFDPNQEHFFFSLLLECLEQKVVTEEFLLQEIKTNHLRKDAFALIEKVKLRSVAV